MALSPWRLFGRLPNSRQLLFLACCLFLFWCITLYRVANVNQITQKESEVLKDEIISLSEKYVRALSRENSDVVDGPDAGRFTAYDLKKTMAVLLESMLERLARLEHQMHHVFNGSNTSLPYNLSLLALGEGHPLRAEDLIQQKAETCELTPEDKQLFPHCQGKIEWMRQMWQSDLCYASYGVDGSECSFVMYLSEVEGWCPVKSWKKELKPPTEDISQIKYADVQLDLDDLMKTLVDPNERGSYAWIRRRIRGMWPRWTTAVKELGKKQDLGKRRKKKILVHLGLLSKQSGWKFAENQFKGGPLGELVQWSDLITTLYILGHDLTITSETEQLANILSQLPAANSPCQSRKELPVQIIYTDIVGLRQFKKHVKGGYGKFSCLLRIVDSFGTEPAYNHRPYARAHKILTSWGGNDLLPQQFYTMFPHSPDNSFMGFVVERHLNTSKSKNIERKNIAVVYGKNEYMWQGKEKYIEEIHKKLEVHGTTYIDNSTKPNPKKGTTPKPVHPIPNYVVNHGLLTAEDFHVLLRQAKVFVGLGFPYEGPAPLEAIANGAVFLNVKFHPPHSSKNTAFFKGKPTSRELTSQHPYIEQFIGPPYSYTVDINNMGEVEAVLNKVLNQSSKFESYMPYEYTEEGMLQRMNAYIEHQNYCQFQKRKSKWPPSSAVTYFLAEQGLDCKEACWKQNLICEPGHFLELNSAEKFSKFGKTCAQEEYVGDIFYPAIDDKNKDCYFQKEEILFSCVGKRDYLKRLCPCRNYIKTQTALCQGCDR
ncbi:hypothetical protein FSP39_016376 [Pinctada imbricata]|uniref:alpha-1,6-mannosyl-glycoprotein 6-beta-N-acetylglucosaminyltransferase n=1 Tax=Pinctada imbricata TaxID=66713 RepID=A0AA89BKZ4_PINIB|nr:hypothetical protein FSP39_016376 [Pinctada imbricata]